VRYQATPGVLSCAGRLTGFHAESSKPGSDQPARSPNRPPVDSGPRTGSISCSPPRTPCSRHVTDVSAEPMSEALVRPRAEVLLLVEL